MKLANKNYAIGIWYKTKQVELFAEFHDKPSIWFKKEEFKKKFKIVSWLLKRDNPILAKICKSERIDNSNVFIVPDFSGRGPNLIMKDIIKVILYVEVFFSSLNLVGFLDGY